MQLSNQLFIVSGVLLGIASVFSYSIIKNLINQFRFKYTMEKAYKAEMARINKFKTEGGMHKWVNNVAIKLPSGKVENTHVCEITGYCPAINGFVSIAQIKKIAIERENEKEFETYKQKRIREVGNKYFTADASDIYEELISIKKDFHINKMNKHNKTLEKECDK